MDTFEIALQLTLKAFDSRAIKLDEYRVDPGEAQESVNAYNAKQIYTFFNEIHKGILDD